MQRKRFLLYPLLLCLGGFAVWVSLIPVAVLSVGETGPLRKVVSGDTFILRYTHSMYGVEVRENFRIGPEDFTLYGVDSSPAVLEYFGIESPGPNNVRRTLKAFTVPAASAGDHELRLSGCRVRLAAWGEEQGQTTVNLARMSLIRYLRELLRR